MAYSLTNLTLKNVKKIEIENRYPDDPTSDQHQQVVWFYHDESELSPLWLDDASPDLEVIYHGQSITNLLAKAKTKGSTTKGFSIKTYDKAVSRLRTGWCSRKELGTTTGLRVSSIDNLLTDIKTEYDVERKRVVLGKDHGESFYTISGKKTAS